MIMNKKYENIVYICTVINSDGRGYHAEFDCEKELNDFINKINLDQYLMIQKIQKIKRFDYQYKNTIIHKPLCFNIDDICEKHKMEDGEEFTFLKKDESLINVEYKDRINLLKEIRNIKINTICNDDE